MKRLVQVISKDSKGLYLLIERLEQDVQLLQNAKENMKLERDLIDRKLQHVSRQNKDTKRSESLLVDKVEELQAIHKQVIEHMEGMQGGARGAFNSLNRRRSQLVGRFTNMLTKKDRTTSNRSDDNQNLDSPTPGEAKAPTATQDNNSTATQDNCNTEATVTGSNATGDPASPGGSNGPPSSGDTNSQRATQDDDNVEKTVTGTFATGDSANAGPSIVTPHTGSSGASPGRKSEQKRSGISSKNGEGASARSQSHELNDQNRHNLMNRAKKAMFHDVEAIRHVIATKEAEIDAMRQEAQTANDRVAQLELDLQKVEQARETEEPRKKKKSTLCAKKPKPLTIGDREHRFNTRSPRSTMSNRPARPSRQADGDDHAAEVEGVKIFPSRPVSLPSGAGPVSVETDEENVCAVTPRAKLISNADVRASSTTAPIPC